MSNVDYILTAKGGLSVTFDGKAYAVRDNEDRFKSVYTLVDKAATCGLSDREEHELRGLLDPSAKIDKYMAPAKAAMGISVEHGIVMRNGEPVHNAVAKRIEAFVKDSLPYTPLLNFMARCEANPNPQSVEELYDFLDRTGLPITPDGHFLAYKGVNEEFRDCYSNRYDNSPGQVHEIPREQVDPDRRRECSYGFHVGAYQYAVNFARGHVMRVKVDPADAVAVPLDHNAMKLRTRKYAVLDEYDTANGEMPLPLYGEKGETFTKAQEEAPAPVADTQTAITDVVVNKVREVILAVTERPVPDDKLDSELSDFSLSEYQDTQISKKLREEFGIEDFYLSCSDTIQEIADRIKSSKDEVKASDVAVAEKEEEEFEEFAPISTNDVDSCDTKFGIDRTTYPENAKAPKIAAWYMDQLGRDDLCRYAACRGVVKNAEEARRIGKAESAKLLAKADLKG